MKTLKCIICKKEFIVHDYRKKTAKYCSRKCLGKDDKANWSKTRFKIGHKSYNKGIFKDISRFKSLYKIWSRKIKERDNYTCQKCGKKTQLISHHIKNWKDYPQYRFYIKNGITLCRKCHLLIHKNDKSIGSSGQNGLGD